MLSFAREEVLRHWHGSLRGDIYSAHDLKSIKIDNQKVAKTSWLVFAGVKLNEKRNCDYSARLQTA